MLLLKSPMFMFHGGWMAAQCSYSEKLFPTSVIEQPAKKIEQDREHQVLVFMFWQSKKIAP